MQKGFIAQEADRIAKRLRNIFVISWAVVIVATAIIYFAFRTEGTDIITEMGGMFPFVAGGIFGVMLLATLAVFLRFSKMSQQPYMYKKALIVHSDKVTQEEAGRTIDQEAAQGKILADECIFTDSKTPRVVLLPSYLLIFEYGIQVFPVNEIYWICAQVGKQGGPFRVKFLVLSEKRIYGTTGWDIEHVKNIADKIYQYVPNVFHNYDTFELSYKLEEAYKKDRSQFLEFYEKHRQEFFESTVKEE